MDVIAKNQEPATSNGYMAVIKSNNGEYLIQFGGQNRGIAGDVGVFNKGGYSHLKVSHIVAMEWVNALNTKEFIRVNSWMNFESALASKSRVSFVDLIHNRWIKKGILQTTPFFLRKVFSYPVDKAGVADYYIEESIVAIQNKKYEDYDYYVVVEQGKSPTFTNNNKTKEILENCESNRDFLRLLGFNGTRFETYWFMKPKGGFGGCEKTDCYVY